MDKNYSTEVRQSPKEKYLKVFFADDNNADSVQAVIENLKSVRKCNITGSESHIHPGKTLTVYPKPMFVIEDIQKEVIKALDAYFCNIISYPLYSVLYSSPTPVDSRSCASPHVAPPLSRVL